MYLCSGLMCQIAGSLNFLPEVTYLLINISFSVLIRMPILGLSFSVYSGLLSLGTNQIN